ncbi:MAG TPA: thioesterase family protein [Acidimicrobiales bacterium]|nr:thioesterase family protein [Acidimicrobiales bacterium]
MHDLGWLGLEQGAPGRWAFELTPGLSRLDWKFYGGTGVAVATAAAEAETGRRCVWMTVQYVATCATGDRVDLDVDVLAGGRRTSQVRVTARHGARTIFVALGATAAEAPPTLEWQAGPMPEVASPAECPPWAPWAVLAKLGIPGGKVPDGAGGDAPDHRPGWLGIVDARTAGPSGAMWMRMCDQPLTRAALGFLADVVPSGVLRAAGRAGGGTSLDNTVRFGAEPDGEWLLVDMDPHLASGGYVSGAARLWSASGRLLGVASQTAAAVLMD